MPQESGTRTLGATTKVFGWVDKSQVEEVLHAFDGFQVLLAITLAGFGAIVAVVIALGAGALHPIAMYLLLCALLAGTTMPAIMTVREHRRYKKVRKRLLAETVQMPVPMMLVTPGQPTFTVGSQGAVTAVTPKSHVVEQEDTKVAPVEANSQSLPPTDRSTQPE